MSAPLRRLRALPPLALAAIAVSFVQVQPASAASVLRVPQAYPTIQQAVDAAVPGDTVLVSPGTYVEQVNFNSKAITLESTDGAAATVIDGNHAGVVVRMGSQSTGTPVLRGFTIRNGFTTEPAGSGVDTRDGAALVERNRITGNSTCWGTVYAAFSSATIRDNVISGNTDTSCGGGLGGGGVLAGGAGTVTISKNVISDNVSASDGGGISLWAAGQPVVSGNLISGNSTPYAGGGISHFNWADSVIVNNIITGNTSNQGGGIYWLTPSGTVGPQVINNTVAGNTGAAVFADGFDAGARLTNNVLVSSGTDAALGCGDLNDQNPPAITYNDVYSAGTGPRYAGLCTDRTGTDGNISADPLFVDPASGNYHLRTASPAVDAGLNSAAPDVDYDGNPRPVDGDQDGTAVVDMGADEVTGPDTVPPTITCTATPDRLSPANHRLRSVQVTVTATDDSGGPVDVTLVSATSSQADSGLGGGDMPGDIQGWTVGTDDRTGQLRAERYGTARVYTLTYQATDQAGNTATCAARVTVP